MDEEEYEFETNAPPAPEAEAQPDTPGPDMPESYRFEDWALI